MRSTRLLLALSAAIVTLHAAAVSAADPIDMNDPRRALGREDDVRVDATILHETVTSGSPISITYQIQNLTAMPVAIAPKSTDVSYDPDTLTITVGLGSEVPADGAMPAITMIKPGEKMTFSAAATPLIPLGASASPYAPKPRYVQLKVSILRDIAPFAAIPAKQPLSDELFDKWLSGNDTILLNAIPVRYTPRARSSTDVEHRGSRGMF